MDLFAIRRRNEWKTPEDLEKTAARSTEIGDGEMSDQVRWIRSYVVNDGDALGTICIYEAVSAGRPARPRQARRDARRRDHADRRHRDRAPRPGAGMHA